MPIWAEKQLEAIIERHSKDGLTENSFGQIRNDLAEVGLEKLLPSAIRHTMEKKDD